MAIGWILIGTFFVLVLFLLAKEEFYEKKEKQRRKDLRANIRWPVFIHVDEKVLEAETANFSAGGALICCPAQWVLPEIVRITIRPPVRAVLDITAEVLRTEVYCPNDDAIPRGIAVRFVIVTERDRKFLSFSVHDHVQ
jgi:hypothetical protein